VLRLTAEFDRGTVTGQVEDRPVKVGAAELRLSELRRLLGPRQRASNHAGKIIRGELKNLDAILVNLGVEKVTLDLTKAREVRFTMPESLTGLECTIVASQEGKEVGRLTRPLLIEGLPAADEEVVDLDIEPPVLAKAMETRELSAPIKDVVCAGGGRYLILHMPRIGKLAIFDVNEAKVVKELPAPEDNLLFAGGLDKLVIALPGAKTMQRWDLNTFTMERTVPLVLLGELTSLTMGSASQGPVVGTYREKNFPWVKFCQFTLDKLQQSQLTFEGPFHQPMQHVHVRAAADGHALAMWSSGQSPSGVTWVKWEDARAKVSYEHSTRGHVIPGSRGKVLFTGMGMFTGITFPNQQNPYPGSDPQGRYLPAVYGDYYMFLGRSNLPYFNPPVGRRPAANALAAPLNGLTIYKLGLALPILKRPDIDLPSADLADKDDFTFDKRVYLIPQAKLLITIPAGNDRLVLRRIDLEEALQKAVQQK